MLGIVNSALAVDVYWDDESGDHSMLTALNYYDPLGVNDNTLPPGKWWVFMDDQYSYHPGVAAQWSADRNTFCYGLVVGSNADGKVELNNAQGSPMRLKMGGATNIGGNGYTGTVDILSDGQGLVSLGNVSIGQSGGTGIVNINAPYTNPTIGYGARMHPRARTYIGAEADSVGVVNVIEGNLDANNLGGNEVFYVGYYGDGRLNIEEGGVVDILGRLDVGGMYNPTTGVAADPTKAKGHIEMTGGLLMADHIYFGLNAKHLAESIVTGTIHQTAGEFLFDGANQVLALNRVNQAISQGWWTTDPGLSLSVWQDTAGTHVTVIPEPISIALLGIGSLFLRRRRR